MNIISKDINRVLNKLINIQITHFYQINAIITTYKIQRKRL